MKVAIIGPAHPLRGGLATYDQRLAEELMAQGHTAVIYSFSLQYPNFLFPGKTQFTDEAAPAGIPIRSVINSVNPLNWLSVGNAMARENFDLVIVRYWLPFMGPAFGTIIRRIKRNKHTRILCIADNVIPHEKRPGDMAFTRYFIKPVDCFITMSKDVLSDLQQLSQKPAQFLHHPVYDNYGPLISKEAACRHLGLDAAKKQILFFGFIRKYKGLDLLLQAMADDRIKAAGIELIVAGEFYDKREGYDEIISTLALKDSVKLFTEFIPNNEVYYYFSAADLVVQPYKSATQSGITQVAYHFEKPMVVTNVGGLAEGVPDGKVGFVCEPEPAAIASAILKFYTPASLPNLEAHIKEEKKKYQWNEFVKKLLAVAKL
jgi:glycosyltransferase involved in cell wall biosynthesis